MIEVSYMQRIHAKGDLLNRTDLKEPATNGRLQKNLCDKTAIKAQDKLTTTYVRSCERALPVEGLVIRVQLSNR